MTHDIEFAVLYGTELSSWQGEKLYSIDLHGMFSRRAVSRTRPLHISQAAEIGKRLGLEGVLTIDEPSGGFPECSASSKKIKKIAPDG